MACYVSSLSGGGAGDLQSELLDPTKYTQTSFGGASGQTYSGSPLVITSALRSNINKTDYFRIIGYVGKAAVQQGPMLIWLKFVFCGQSGNPDAGTTFFEYNSTVGGLTSGSYTYTQLYSPILNTADVLAKISTMSSTQDCQLTVTMGNNVSFSGSFGVVKYTKI